MSRYGFKKTISITVIIMFLFEAFFLSTIIVARAQYNLYPKMYEEYVSRYSEEYGVPESLIYATIKVESGFSPDAVSSKGATGLMQLMPATFIEMTVLCGDMADVSLITDEKLNIKYGTIYLSEMHDKFGRWDYAVMAYNAGPAKVSEWVKAENFDSEGNIIDIPFEETRKYIKKIKRAKDKYCKLYEMENFNMEETVKNQEIEKELTFKKTNIFEKADEKEMNSIFSYAEGYKEFLNNAKTEREAVTEGIKMAVEKGYSPYKLGEPLKKGDKKYYVNRKKSLYLFKIGEDNIEEDGIRILAAHIDSPRIDLKQNPLYEDSGMGFFKTHYYGGIKKYQWTAIPLALHGVIIRSDGSCVDIKIGEDDNDPVFYINDLLPHLASEQMQQPVSKAISGESLNILIGGIPVNDEAVEGKIKLNILKLLNEKYGITEGDFISAEISAVPAFKSRDVGFDRAFVGAYGHDDRVCAYPAMTALLDTEDDKHTTLVILADKEEIGSEGNTGMQCRLLLDIIDQISAASGKNSVLVRANSKCLSADVNAAYDPNFVEVYEKRNSAMISCGTTMSKYTGSRGKSGTSDASAEFVGFVRKVFGDNGIKWQTSELGKVDIGGGGTVAMYIANLNIDTVDMGVPVISMHAPYEVISKADLYSTYLAFRAFCK